jgi:hypothetical protein
MDTSWELSWNETSVLLDPWLIGSEVDGFSWFNEQWHVTKPVSIDTIKDYQGIIISQSYSDHLHQETMLSLKRVPIYAPPSAKRRIRKELPEHEFNMLNPVISNKWLSIGSIEISYLDPGRRIDPIYNGVALKHDNEVVVYFPHGFTLNETQLNLLKKFKVRLLITSFSLFRLPAFLGGAVNPGMENAMRLVGELDPDKVVHTHDENKHARGLVKKIAKVSYPDDALLKQRLSSRFIYTQYEPVILG